MSLSNKSQQEAGSTSPTEDARKRVTKACDRCRLKKIKCDGIVPCTRCQADSSICQYGERKRSVDRRIPPGYVEYLEDSQQLLVKALKKSWTQNLPSESSSQQASDDPSVHAILQELGVLSQSPAQSSSGDDVRFDEDFENIRQQFEQGQNEPSGSSHSLSSSVPQSRAPSQPASDAPSPVSYSPEAERHSSSRAFLGSGTGVYSNQYPQVPQTSMSTSHDPNFWLDSSALANAAPYPSFYTQNTGSEWGLASDIPFEGQSEQMNVFNQSLNPSSQGLAGWQSDQGHRQQSTSQQQQQRPGPLRQHSEAQGLQGTSGASQYPDSTVHPSQLSLPTSQPLDPADADAWYRWLNERGE